MKTLCASVGYVQFFDPSNNNLIVSAKTCTTTGINIGVTAEEARGGQGNPLIGKYYHDSSFGLNIEDQLFDLEYIALNCGGQITAGGDVMKSEQVVVGVDGVITVSEQPVAFGKTVVGWVKKPNETDDKTVTVTFDENAKTALTPYTAGDTVCVSYFYNSDSARSFKVSSAFIPSVVHAIMKVPMFKAGVGGEIDTTSSEIGELIIDIPQLQLEGSQEFSLTASGIASSSLSGSALATFESAESCSSNGYYAIITENIFNRDEFDNVKEIVVEESDIDLKVNETQPLSVLAIFNDNTLSKKIDASKLTFVSEAPTIAQVSSAGVVTAKAVGSTNIEVTVTDHTEIKSATARVTVTA